jgi:hypothetical protein
MILTQALKDWMNPLEYWKVFILKLRIASILAHYYRFLQNESDPKICVYLRKQEKSRSVYSFKSLCSPISYFGISSLAQTSLCMRRRGCGIFLILAHSSSRSD